MTDQQRKTWIRNARCKIYYLECRVSSLEKQLAEANQKIEIMTKGQPNLSWREQRKAVIRTQRLEPPFMSTDECFQSVWMAAKAVSKENGCQLETAKKEIRKAIRTGHARYGYYWAWREDDNDKQK